MRGELFNKRNHKPADFDISLVVNELRGSYVTIDEVLEKLYSINLEALSKEDIEFIDSQIFLCDICKQWNDIEKQADEKTCEDCYANEVDHLDENGYYKEDEEDETDAE